MKTLKPYPYYHYVQPFHGNYQDALSDVGCIIVAGGSGSRLGTAKPKGMFPISHLYHKSLFQIFCEKTAVASKRAGKALPLAVMTSENNHEVIQDFFAEHDNFGLIDEQVDFFQQEMLPYLDDDNNVIVDEKGDPLMDAAGNGSMFSSFYNSPLWDKWKNVRITSVIPIENPLADPFDGSLITFHKEQQNDFTLKCTEKIDPLEKVGVVAQTDNGVAIVEYTELSEEMQKQREPDGRLSFLLANLGLYCISLSLFPSVNSLPLHIVKKTIQGKQLSGWKSETYSFDALVYAKKAGVIVYPREQCFAPLKNAEGEYGIDFVRQAMQQRDRDIYADIMGKEADADEVFELEQEYYYPTPTLREQCLRRSL